MVNLVLLLGLVSGAKSQDSLIISTESTVWSSQNDNCVLATPDVDTLMDYQVNESLDIDLPFNEHIWVGYFQVTRAFEYVGFVPMLDIFNNEDQPFVEIKIGPRNCFPGCSDDTTVGFSGNRCYCLCSKFDVTKYAPNTDNIRKPLLHIFKINKNGNRSQVRKLTGRRKKAWLEATSDCFGVGMVPAVFSGAFKVDQHHALWTGLFKAKIIYKQNAEDSGQRKVDKRQFGYLTRDSEKRVKLKFTEINANHKQLCIQEEGSKVASIATVICTSLAVILVIIVSLGCFYKHRMNHNVLSESNYISAVYSTTEHGSNAAVPVNDAIDQQPGVLDISSQYNQTTPKEIVHPHYHTIQLSNDASTTIAYSSLEVD